MTQSGHCPLSFRLTTLQSLLPSSLVLGFLYFAQSTRVDEAIMSKEIQRIQARARELARSGTFIGWRPIAFELQFEPGFTEAYEWIHSASAQEELDSLCREARMLRYVDRHGPKAA
jgi:hypothetical protein